MAPITKVYVLRRLPGEYPSPLDGTIVIAQDSHQFAQAYLMFLDRTAAEQSQRDHIRLYKIVSEVSEWEVRS